MVNAAAIIDLMKDRLNSLTKAYESNDWETFNALASTSIVSGPEAIQIPRPVLDEDLEFTYRGHRFTVTNCVAATNDQLRSKLYSAILTDRTVIWELVPSSMGYGEDYEFVAWCYWEFRQGEECDRIVTDLIDRYLDKEVENA